MTDNLLTNPEFSTLSGEVREFPRYTAGWQAFPGESLQTGHAIPDGGEGAAVILEPGGRLTQFISLSDIPQVKKGAELCLAVSGQQQVPSALEAILLLRGIESEGGTWVPEEAGPFEDNRTFYRHGRGELVSLSRATAMSPDESGVFRMSTPLLTVDWFFETEQKVLRGDYRNAVGIEVQLVNQGDQPLTLWHPTLKLAGDGDSTYRAGRPLAEYSRKIPRTIAKLLAGEPIHILVLGSSIDRGSANPRNYVYQEDPQKPGYKLPLVNDKPFDGKWVGHPELNGHIGWFQHYFMYTGRLRLALMDKFALPVDRILLNTLARDGSSIGESHSAFREYSRFEHAPGADHNGHADGGFTWQELYPSHFQDGQLPAPDLVIFGSGHNARVDLPDEAAIFEGAIRWFQRHYPDVEFITAMWIRSDSDGLHSSMPKLSAHYGIPYIDVRAMMRATEQSANRFALMPDGGHPQAAAHYLWFKQLEKAFDIVSPLAPPEPQRYLPPRWNPYSYLWEGDMHTVIAPSPRLINDEAFIAAEGPIVIWASQADTDAPEPLQLRINGEMLKRDAGRGRNYTSRNPRNASLLRGRMEPGWRHVIEVVGNEARIHGFDEKLAPDAKHFPAGNPAWQAPVTACSFTSGWGAPYGESCYRIQEGQALTLSGEGDCIAVTWLDAREGGSFEVWVDGEYRWTQVGNQPFVDRHGVSHWMENRRPVAGLDHGPHTLEIRVIEGSSAILGATFYSINP